jgi:hypothetical protein
MFTDTRYITNSNLVESLPNLAQAKKSTPGVHVEEALADISLRLDQALDLNIEFSKRPIQSESKSKLQTNVQNLTGSSPSKAIELSSGPETSSDESTEERTHKRKGSPLDLDRKRMKREHSESLFLGVESDTDVDGDQAPSFFYEGLGEEVAPLQNPLPNDRELRTPSPVLIRSTSRASALGSPLTSKTPHFGLFCFNSKASAFGPFVSASAASASGFVRSISVAPASGSALSTSSAHVLGPLASTSAAPASGSALSTSSAPALVTAVTTSSAHALGPLVSISVAPASGSALSTSSAHVLGPLASTSSAHALGSTSPWPDSVGIASGTPMQSISKSSPEVSAIPGVAVVAPATAKAQLNDQIASIIEPQPQTTPEIEKPVENEDYNIEASSSTNITSKPGKREIASFRFVVWCEDDQKWKSINDLPGRTQNAIKERFESLYKGKGKAMKGRMDRLARMTGLSNVAKHLDKSTCVTGTFIDKRATTIESKVACDTCVRLRYQRICVQLVTVNKEKCFGILPMPVGKRQGAEMDNTFWFA